MKFYSRDPIELLTLLTQVKEESIGVLRCFSELRRVSLEQNTSRLGILNNNGISLIHQAMSRHALNPDVLITACKLLQTLISYDGSNRKLCHIALSYIDA